MFDSFTVDVILVCCDLICLVFTDAVGLGIAHFWMRVGICGFEDCFSMRMLL